MLKSDFFPSEIRLKKLYEYAEKNRDNVLKESLGFITTDYIGDKNALPLSVYRLRKTVEDIKNHSAIKINQFTEQLYNLFPEKLSDILGKEYKNYKTMRKTAARKKVLFWRVS